MHHGLSTRTSHKIGEMNKSLSHCIQHRNIHQQAKLSRKKKKQATLNIASDTQHYLTVSMRCIIYQYKYWWLYNLTITLMSTMHGQKLNSTAIRRTVDRETGFSQHYGFLIKRALQTFRTSIPKGSKGGPQFRPYYAERIIIFSNRDCIVTHSNDGNCYLEKVITHGESYSESC